MPNRVIYMAVDAGAAKPMRNSDTGPACSHASPGAHVTCAVTGAANVMTAVSITAITPKQPPTDASLCGLGLICRFCEINTVYGRNNYGCDIVDPSGGDAVYGEP